MERGLEMANDKEETPEDIERTKEQHRQRLSEAIEESKKNNQNGNGKNKQKEKPRFDAYKYSNNGKGPLFEVIILTGSRVFIAYQNGKIEPYKDLGEDVRIIAPPHFQSYPYLPYEFKNMDAVLKYRDRALAENIDTLYVKAKSIARQYTDQRKEKTNLLATEIIASYFQDQFPTTHYTVVLGGNGSGKSSYGDTYTVAGYRAVNLTDPNAANINRILGCIEIGQCTIVSDETGPIDRNPDLMAILKTGYSPTGRTSKINDYSRAPEFFYTYCFKIIISERMPNLRDAKSVVDRSFTFTTYKGKPIHDIKETLIPQRNPARLQRLAALLDFRKLMLIYRLIHFGNQMADIDVNVEGREKELTKPIIQLFYNTQAQKEVEQTLQYFLNLKSDKKEITIEPVLHQVVRKLVNEYGYTLYVKTIWDQLRASIQDGYYDDKKPNEYQTIEYGTIYNNSISNILEHMFGGRPKHKESGNIFIFDPEELERIGRAYNLTTNIQTKIVLEHEYRTRPEGSEGSEAIRKEPPPSNSKQNIENSEISRGNQVQHDNKKRQNKGGRHSVEPSEGSDPSGQVIEKSSSVNSKHKHNSYFSFGKWHCNDCKANGDKFHMQNTPCKGAKT